MRFTARVQGSVCTALGAALLFAGCGKNAEESCGTGGPCEAGAVCIDDACHALCNTTTDCGIGETCSSGACYATFCVIDGVELQPDARDPGEPCRGCQPAVSAIAYSTLPDGTPCDDDLFCTTTGACASGACAPGPSPCPARQPFCSEAQQVCVCTPSSCDDGLFCSGEEFCAATGECGAENVPACDGEFPICSDVAGRCVECDSAAGCGEPNPYCVGFRCTGCPTCTCPVGQHEGGDGTCVDIGACAAGYRLAFVDGDRDGHGLGSVADTCAPTTLPLGFADTGGDCDDGNASVWQTMTGYPDVDGDGVTAAGVELCAGGALPSGYLAAAVPPAYAAMTTVVQQGGAGGCEGWSRTSDATTLDGNYARCQPRNTRDCCPLTVTNLKLGVPAAAVISGVRVRVWREATEAGTRSIVDLTARLLVANVASGDNQADTVTKWPTTITEKDYGGPNELWGLSLTPAQVNATGFGFSLTTTFSGNDGAEGHVDYLTVEVFLAGDADCNDGDDTAWALRELYVDADHDGYTVGSATSTCLGAAVPAGHGVGSLGEDCYDGNANAHPNQTAYYSAQRGDGSFDYNCNTTIEKAAIGYATACGCDVTFGCISSASSSFAPTTACGASNSVDACTGECTTPTCTLGAGAGSTATRCH